MKIYGDLNIRRNFKANGYFYEGGILTSPNDSELRNLTDLEDGEVVITLHDYLLNVYDYSDDSWNKYYSSIIHPKTGFSLSSDLSGCIITDLNNENLNNFNLYLPPVEVGLFYTFIKTKYSEDYTFSVIPYGSEYLDDGDQLIKSLSLGINIIQLVGIDFNNWIIIKHIGEWIYV